MTAAPRFNRACSLADWSDPEFHRVMTDVFGYGKERLARHQQRKQWEWTMGWLGLEHYGFLTRDKTALGLGCGHELFMYALTNRVQHVTGTDLYGATGFSDDEAQSGIVENPAKFCPLRYEAGRLTVRSMDARNIDYPDNHFDILFSFSSLEHFGNNQQIIQAMREAYRVLKPGGIYALDVDYIFKGPQPTLPRDRRRASANELMTREDIERLLLASTGFQVEQPIHFDVQPPADANIFDIHTKQSTRGRYHPHVFLRAGRWPGRRYYFTSLSLALFKPV